MMPILPVHFSRAACALPQPCTASCASPKSPPQCNLVDVVIHCYAIKSSNGLQHVLVAATVKFTPPALPRRPQQPPPPGAHSDLVANMLHC
eukprot:1140452-Pelagomonas_calceolata.AAC.1